MKITDCLNGRTGNHMIFFPSFEYMNQIMPKIEMELNRKSVTGYKIISQIAEMTGVEKEEFLKSYSEKFGDGFSFAYRFPGWQKVLQAVGRVIRTETDTGFALLIDERLAKPEYIMLYPDHWKI